MSEPLSDEGLILASASYDHTIRFWQPSTGMCQRTLQHTESQVNALAVTPDRKLLAAAGYQHIRMYDVVGSSSVPVVNFDGITKNVTALGFQSEGRWMFTGGEDNSARIWDLRSRTIQCQRIFQVNTPVNSVCLHPNQSELFVADQHGTLYLWDLRTDHNEQLLPEPGVSILCVAVDPEATMLAAVNSKGFCYVWNLISGANGSNESSRLVPKCRFECHKKFPLKCYFSPDSTLFVTTSADHSAKVWRTADFSEIHTLKTDSQRWVWDAAFTNDSSYLFTASSDNFVRMWKTETGEVVREYGGHQKAVTALAFCDLEGR